MLEFCYTYNMLSCDSSMCSYSKNSVCLLIQKFYGIFLSVSIMISKFGVCVVNFRVWYNFRMKMTRLAFFFFNFINFKGLNYQLYGYFWLFSATIWRFKCIESFLLSVHVSIYSLYSCTHNNFLWFVLFSTFKVKYFYSFKKYIYLGCCTFWHFYGKSSIWMDAWHIFGSSKNPPSRRWNHCSISYIWNLQSCSCVGNCNVILSVIVFFISILVKHISL